MVEDHANPVFDWFANQHVPGSRDAFLEQAGPILASLVRPGDRVLDLCCGAGAISFFLEDLGAEVTAIDQASGLIAMARAEAAKRGSRVAFVEDDVLTGALGDGRYALAVCLGNAVLDFPPAAFPRFGDRVRRALQADGRLALEYHDGVVRLLDMREPAEVTEQGATGPVRRVFRTYDPERGGYEQEYRNLVTGEVFDYTGYVYTGPVIRALLGATFDFERSTRLSERSFLDVFAVREAP